MTLKRFKSLIGAYGTEVSRWPEAERDNALTFLKENPKAAEVFQAASPLDAVLGAMPKPAGADEAYLKRLGTIPFASRSLGEANPTTFGEFMKGFFPAKRYVPQGVGLAAVGILGIWMGLIASANEPTDVVELNPTNYFLENTDLDKDVEDLR